MWRGGIPSTTLSCSEHFPLLLTWRLFIKKAYGVLRDHYSLTCETAVVSIEDSINLSLAAVINTCEEYAGPLEAYSKVFSFIQPISPNRINRAYRSISDTVNYYSRSSSLCQTFPSQLISAVWHRTASYSYSRLHSADVGGHRKSTFFLLYFSYRLPRLTSSVQVQNGSD
jgi:hypothetical protein